MASWSCTWWSRAYVGRVKHDSIGAVVRDYGRYALLLGLFAAALVGLELFDALVLRGALDQFGIRPRTPEGLRGIALAPFLHGNLHHVIANAGSMLVLGSLLLARGPRIFWLATVFSVLISGLGIWAVGATHSLHIGASGLIFGWLGTLLAAGWYERRFTSMLVSLLCLVAFGGMIWGVLPGTPGISWEAHMFGFIGGVLAARLLKPRAKRARDSSKTVRARG